MKETVDLEYCETLLPCPFCGTDSAKFDELGRIKPDVVQVERRVRKRPWAEIYPPDDQYAVEWSVVCSYCRSRSGSRTSRLAAVAMWQTRLTPDMTPEEREDERRAVEESLLAEPDEPPIV